MKRIYLIFICLLIFRPLNIKAVSAETIISYVKSEDACDEESASLLVSYIDQLDALISKKDMTEEELNNLFNKIKSAKSILDSYNVCKRSDLYTIPKDIRENVKSYLYEGLLIINNAKNKDDTNITISISEDKRVTIMENNKIINTINIDLKEFNDVGSNSLVIITLIVNIFLFIIFLIIIIKSKKLKEIASVCLVFTSTIIVFFIVFNSDINKYISLIGVFRKENLSNLTDATLDSENKIINYPSIYKQYATLSIDRLNIKENIYYGDNKEILSLGVGTDSEYAIFGEGKSTVLSIHNYKVNSLKDIKNNDIINVDTNYGEFTYQVDNIKIMNKNEYGKIKNKYDNEYLILYTCYPFNNLFYTNKRLMIYAKKIKGEYK